MNDRITIVIVDRTQQYRFPVTKKRRIRNKWRKRAENYRPMMVPVGMSLMMGAEAAIRADAKSGPVPNYFEMSTDLWCYVAGTEPEFAARCDLFERVVEERGGIVWEENVPI